MYVAIMKPANAEPYRRIAPLIDLAQKYHALALSRSLLGTECRVVANDDDEPGEGNTPPDTVYRGGARLSQ